MDNSCKKETNLHFHLDPITGIHTPLTKQFELKFAGYFEEAKWHQLRPRTIDEFVFLYCIKGSGSIQLNHQKTFLNRDQCLLIPPNLKHEYASDPHHPWSLYWFHCDGELCHYYLKYFKEEKHFIRQKPFSQTTINDFSELFQLLKSDLAPLHYMQAQSIALKILSRSILDTESKNVFEPLLLWFNNNLDKNFESKLCCKLTGLNKHTLFRKFKQRYKMTPLEYFTGLKINKACMLLENSHLNISEVGQQVGFDDPYYFSRVFKKVKGNSPLSYQKHLNHE